MHSSISSSNERAPQLRWGRLFGIGAAMIIGVAALLELALAVRGFECTVVDSQALWDHERLRADQLGSRALILVGASRIQLGIDLDILRSFTGLEPVQLAVDGGSWRPVVHGLALDPTISGTILIDYYDQSMVQGDVLDPALVREREFQKTKSRAATGNGIETWLTSLVHNHLRAYADGAPPIKSLLVRVLDHTAAPQYLITLPDRSRIADYSKVDAQELYLIRSMQALAATDGALPRGTRAQKLAYIEGAITQIHAEKAAHSDAAIESIRDDFDALKRRGGRIIFVRMPTSGYVRESEERRYPRADFEDRFVAELGVPIIDFRDFAAMRQFECPDGSHLDGRSRNGFTAALVSALPRSLIHR